MTQAQQIREHLLRGERITPLDALRRYGCFRLGARIYELRRAGLPIDREMVEGEGGKRFAEYRLTSKAA